MNFESRMIETIYNADLAKKYDYSLPPFFANWKRKAFNESSLKQGDSVLVFCCGTGLDFHHILKRIGTSGKITGVDFSASMLIVAKEKIRKNKWENIELIEADITQFHNILDKKADVGVCTLGLSIIPEFETAYRSLLSNVKNHGEIIIGDMQLASGWLARLNPFTIFLSKKYGGTFEGHQNSLKLNSIMKRELIDIKRREFFFKSYYYSIGKKKLAGQV